LPAAHTGPWPRVPASVRRCHGGLVTFNTSRRRGRPPATSAPRAVHAAAAPCASSSRCRSEREDVPSSSRNCHPALPTPLCLSTHLCSFIATPLSPLRHHTLRPTSYRPVRPASPPSRCSQPRGESTTSAPARAPHRPPSSTMANSSSTGHLWLCPPPSPPP
jgi:hypothetical protein